MAPSECHDIVNTNLNSAILGSRYAVKAMIRGKTGGCIINVSSALARKGIEGTSVYAASKAGLLGMVSLSGAACPHAHSTDVALLQA